MFLLPASLAWDFFWLLRSHYATFMRPVSKHSERVKYVQDQVKRWNQTGSTKPMVTGRPGMFTMSQKIGEFKADCHKIQIDLIDILHIDTKKQTVLVEPGANMGQITRALIPMGWTLAITPELDDLTVGGLLMGFGVESSSHKYGLFQDICSSYEVVLADGSLVTATATENVDLFRALPWSHGTLGFLTAAEIKIIPAKKFVELNYKPFHNKKEMLKYLNKVSCGEGMAKPDFVEGLAFGDQEYVIMTANLSNGEKQDIPTNVLSRWYKPWFFLHVKSFLSIGEHTEYVPLRDYYHRHTRSIFWEMEFLVPFGNHPLFRFFLGWMLPPKIPMLKLTQTDTLERLFREQFMFQDMLVPMDDLDATLSFFNDDYDVYPLWMCPHLVFNTAPQQGMLHPSKPVPVGESQMFIDIGAYGHPHKPFNHLVDMPKAEKFVRDHNGYQALYAHTYMTYEEFREMFDHDLYDQMRKKYKAEKAFPEVYDKIYGDKRKSFNRNTSTKYAKKA